MAAERRSSRASEGATDGPARRVGFLDEESGQISFLALWSAVALAAFIGLLANTQQQTGWRVRSQAAADATSMAAATWVARGLNVTAACNSVQAQSLGGIIVLTAFYRTYNQPPVEQMATAYEIAIKAACEALGAIPYAGPVLKIACMATLWACAKAQIMVIKAMKPVSRTMHRALSEKNKALWKLMDAMEKLNGLVGPSFSIMAQVQACEIAKANGASEVIVYRHSDNLADIGLGALGNAIESEAQGAAGIDSGCVGIMNTAQQFFGGRPWVPTKKGTWDEICDAAWDATGAKGLNDLHGYPNGPAKDGKERVLDFGVCLSDLGVDIPVIGDFLCVRLMGPQPVPIDCLGPIPRGFFPWHVDAVKAELCGGSAGDPPTVSMSSQLASLEQCFSSSNAELVWTLGEKVLADGGAQVVRDDRYGWSYGNLYETKQSKSGFDYGSSAGGSPRTLTTDEDEICGDMAGTFDSFGGGDSFTVEMKGCKTGCRMTPPSNTCDISPDNLPAGYGDDGDLRYTRQAGGMSFRSEVLEYEVKIWKEVPQPPPPEPEPGEDPPPEPDPVYEQVTYYQYRYRTWVAQGCQSLNSEDYGTPTTSGSGSKRGKAKPYVLDFQDIRKDLSFIAVLGFDQEPAAFMGNIFGSSPARISFSSAETYNGLFPDWDPDNFTQDWRARLRTTDFGITQQAGLSLAMQDLTQRIEGGGGLTGLIRGAEDVVDDPESLLVPFLASSLNNH